MGPSGAGKTTLFNLLLGFCQPTAGNIFINDRDLSTYDPKIWRQQLSWLGQNPRLFQGSLRENILLGKPNASVAELERAVQAAHVSELIRALPHGLDTQIGEQSLGLSGGQAQRIALARAFLKDAPILLLDEPTASLDRESAQCILTTLEELSQDKIVLMATHHLPSLALAQRIVVIDQGRIVEAGSFAELQQNNALFQRMLAEMEEVTRHA